MPAPQWVHDLFDLLPADKQEELLEAMKLGVRARPLKTLTERLEKAKAESEKPSGVAQN